MTVKDCTSVKEFWQLKKEIRCNSDSMESRGGIGFGVGVAMVGG